MRRIVLAGLVSGFGDRLNQVALAALILAVTGSIGQAALVFVVSTLPYVLFGLIVGALVDRWSRRAAMVGADLARAGLVAAIPFAAGADIHLVYPLLFAITCANMLFGPAQQSLVPDVVDPDDLTAANALIRTAQYLTDLIGYPIAAGLVAVLVDALGPVAGTRLAFAADAASFVVSALLLWRLPAGAALVGRGKAQAVRLWQQVTDGLRFLAGHPQVRTNTLLLTVGPLLLGSLHTLWIGFAWRVSHTDALGFGITESMTGAGVMVGAWALGRAGGRLNRGRVILLGFAVYGAAILAVGMTSSIVVAALLAAVAGAGNITFLVPSITLVQQQTPSDLRGRVFGVRLTLTYAAFAISNALAGSLSEALGVSALMLILGTCMVGMAAAAYAVPSAREAT